MVFLKTSLPNGTISTVTRSMLFNLHVIRRCQVDFVSNGVPPLFHFKSVTYRVREALPAYAPHFATPFFAHSETILTSLWKRRVQGSLSRGYPFNFSFETRIFRNSLLNKRRDCTFSADVWERGINYLLNWVHVIWYKLVCDQVAHPTSYPIGIAGSVETLPPIPLLEGHVLGVSLSRLRPVRVKIGVGKLIPPSVVITAHVGGPTPPSN